VKHKFQQNKILGKIILNDPFVINRIRTKLEGRYFMLGVRCRGNKGVSVIQYPDPIAREDEVVVKVKSTALCGSDLPAYTSPGEKEIIQGHESAGEVVAVDKARFIKKGDRVSLYSATSCGFCRYCRQGNYIFCNRGGALGFTRHGGQAEYILVPERNCFRLPETVSYDIGCLLFDMLGTPYHAIKRLGVNGRDTVAIFGAGPIGLGAIMICKFLGCRIIVINRNEKRMNLAKETGADFCLNPKNEDILRRIREITNGEGVDVSLECTGASEMVPLALESCAKAGRMAFIGEIESATIQPSNHLIRKNLLVIGSWYCNSSEFEELLSLVQRGMKIERVVTHKFPLEQAVQAYQAFDSGITGKVILYP
jgi:threonine dehydrogenase-like Zn-dependent dehydrogenase